ncbi:SigE family RNA polymerase sigma factor [Nocardioides marinquilinus]|uniref:SigE family RNA polymerase sigma factor n=1 Tax=Nocardioides marinquilinus TaxID=1210400 RepID=A0ABP9PJ13_9ACTN
MRTSQRDQEFSEFVSAHRARLVAMARLLTAGDEAWAEDCVQTALTRLYLAWPKARVAENRVAYARTAVTRVFVDETRRAHRRREVTAGPDCPPDGPRRAGAPDGAETADLRHDVLAALAGLAPRQRAVVVLRHWLDLDVAETARQLDCSEGTVKSQNAKALAHLRDALGDHVVPAQAATAHEETR